MKEKYLLKKIVSCICVLIACATLFYGWVAIRDNEYTREIKSSLREFEDELDELEDYCKDFQDELDDNDVDVSVISIYNTVEKFYYTIEDLALSPKELADVYPLLSKVHKTLDELEKNEIYGMASYYINDLEDLVRDFEQIMIVFIIITACFVLTVGFDIMYVILHLFNKRGVGGAAITFHVIWGIVLTAIVVLVNFVMMDEYNIEILTMTPAPYIGIAMIIISAIIWGSARKDYAAISASGVVAGTSPMPSQVRPVVSAPVASSNQVSLEKKVCLQCGAECIGDALFCRGCGSKLEQEVKQEEKQEEMMFCGNCGKQIVASALFCNHCGSKIL